MHRVHHATLDRTKRSIPECSVSPVLLVSRVLMPLKILLLVVSARSHLEMLYCALRAMLVISVRLLCYLHRLLVMPENSPLFQLPRAPRVDLELIQTQVRQVVPCVPLDHMQAI